MERSWWTDAHFCKLPSQTDYLGIPTTPQTNVYGHAKVIDPQGTNKLLIASLAGKITALEYQQVFDKLTPSTKEIHFTYIPAGSELVSIDVINKTSSNGLIVGVTFIRLLDPIPDVVDSEHSQTQYLNVYSSNQPGEETTLESVAQECISIPLNFVPYQLTHTVLITGSKKEQVFLLSGSDLRVHLYREVSLPDTNEQTFMEEPVENHFPEFQNIKSCIQWIDIVYFDDHRKRLTATGHQDGLVQVQLIDVLKNEIQQSWCIEHDSPITCIRLFYPYNKVPCPSFVQSAALKNDIGTEKTNPVYHLLVLGALEPTTIYRDILRNDFKDLYTLPDSDRYDIPLCACIVDVDFDGQNEILIGTYGQELLAYKFIEKDITTSRSNSVERADEEVQTIIQKSNMISVETLEKHRHKSNETESTSAENVKDASVTRKTKSQENLALSLKNSPQTTDACIHNDKDIKVENSQSNILLSPKESYQLLWQHSFPCPIMGVDRVDIMGDGMDDIVVVTLRGMHVIQPNLHEVANVCLQRLKLLADTDEDGKT